MRLIPSREISLEDRKRFRLAAMGIGSAVSRGITNKDGAEPRDLLPSDLGLVNWETPGTNLTSYIRWFSHLNSPDRVIVIYKILQLSLSPSIMNIKFFRAGIILGEHNLDSCYGSATFLIALKKLLTLDTWTEKVIERLAGKEPVEHPLPDLAAPMEGYFSEPYIYGPQAHLEVDIMASRETNGDYLVLGGYVIEV